MTDFVGFAYAAVVAIGGIIGYLKAGSVASLGSGLAFGGISAFGAYQISSGAGHTVMILASGVLSGVMGFRFYNSHKVMPAGLVFFLRYGAACYLRLHTQCDSAPRK